MSSERMRELQEMEKQIGDVELGEIQPDRGGTVGGREVSLGAGSFIATDSSKGKEEERKALLKRLAGAKRLDGSRGLRAGNHRFTIRAGSFQGFMQGKHGPQLSSWKLWVVVGLTVVSCLALLWALFSGATPDKFVAPFSTYTKCTPGSELEAQYKAFKRSDNCPDPAWLPMECKSESRKKSMTYMDNCARLFADCGYSVELLQNETSPGPQTDASNGLAHEFEEIATMDFPFEGIPTIPPRKDMDRMAFFCSGCRYRVTAYPDWTVEKVKQALWNGGIKRSNKAEEKRNTPGLHKWQDLTLLYAGSIMKDEDCLQDYKVPAGCKCLIAIETAKLHTVPEPDSAYWN